VAAAGFRVPPAVIRTRAADDRADPVSLIFGSCRDATPDATGDRLPPDALDAFARRLMADPQRADLRPDLIVLLGDQVYADQPSAKVRHLLRHRRANGHAGPTDQVGSFDEYTKLYLESWHDPEVRWLLSTVPSAMIFDDHEIIDDWNTSVSWRADIARQPWWAERIAAGLASYWVYQHLGNLGPAELAADPLYQKVTTVDDATELLHDFGRAVDAASGLPVEFRARRGPHPGGRAGQPLQPGADPRPSCDAARRRVELVRRSGARRLRPPGRRLVAAVAHAAGDPPPRGVERAQGRLAVTARRGPRREDPPRVRSRALGGVHPVVRRARRAVPAARRGPAERAGERVGAGDAFAAPASISVLSGDVHHSYVARAFFGAPTSTPVMQLTCSPVHNQVPAFMRPFMRLSWSGTVARAVRSLARAAGVRKPGWTWSRLAGPYFGNAVSTLRLAGRQATVRVEGTDRNGDLFEVATVEYPG